MHGSVSSNLVLCAEAITQSAEDIMHLRACFTARGGWHHLTHRLMRRLRFESITIPQGYDRGASANRRYAVDGSSCSPMHGAIGTWC